MHRVKKSRRPLREGALKKLFEDEIGGSDAVGLSDVVISLSEANESLRRAMKTMKHHETRSTCLRESKRIELAIDELRGALADVMPENG